MNKIKKTPDDKFDEKMIESMRITKSMMIQVFEDKKGLKVSDMLKTLPVQDLFVLDAICNLFDD